VILRLVGLLLVLLFRCLRMFVCVRVRVDLYWLWMLFVMLVVVVCLVISMLVDLG